MAVFCIGTEDERKNNDKGIGLCTLVKKRKQEMESENDVGKEKKSDGWCEKVQD